MTTMMSLVKYPKLSNILKKYKNFNHMKKTPIAYIALSRLGSILTLKAFIDISVSIEVGVMISK
jgi:hypothetical protein